MIGRRFYIDVILSVICIVYLRIGYTKDTHHDHRWAVDFLKDATELEKMVDEGNYVEFDNIRYSLASTIREDKTKASLYRKHMLPMLARVIRKGVLFHDMPMLVDVLNELVEAGTFDGVKCALIGISNVMSATQLHERYFRTDDGYNNWEDAMFNMQRGWFTRKLQNHPEKSKVIDYIYQNYIHNNPKDEKRKFYVLIVGWFGDKRVLDDLIDLLAHHMLYRIRENSAQCLGHFPHDEKIINALVKALDDQGIINPSGFHETYPVRQVAIHALAKLAPDVDTSDTRVFNSTPPATKGELDYYRKYKIECMKSGKIELDCSKEAKRNLANNVKNGKR